MQFIRRDDEVPEVLASPEARRSRRVMVEFMLQDRERRSQTSVPRFGLEPSHPALVEAVSTMSLGRCAFCEMRDELNVHRFRPVGDAIPVASRANPHLYYVWLADAWQNLFPICRGCTPAEPHFPVTGSRCKLPTPQQLSKYAASDDGRWTTFPPSETIELLDPSIDRQYDRHLAPRLDGSLVGISKKGTSTITVFSLNREERVTQRRDAYARRIGRLAELLRRSERSVEEEAVWRELFNFDRIELGGTWYLLLRRLARRIGGSSGVRPQLARTQIGPFFLNLAARGGATAAFDEALAAVKRDDGGLRERGAGLGPAFSVKTPIRRIDISNFKTIERLVLELPAAAKEDSDGRQRAAGLMILGENATGKSSVLEAIALTVTTEKARQNLGIPWDRIPLDPELMGAEGRTPKRRARVRIEFETGQVATLHVAEGEFEPDSEFGNGQVPVFAYGAFRRFLTGAHQSSAHKHVRNLFDGSTLANPEPWLKSLGKERFDMVVRTLRDLLSIDGGFEVIQRDRTGRQLRMVTAVIQPDGTQRLTKTPLQAVSSGYRSMLAMVCDIMRGLTDENVYESFDSFETARGIVIIDEIEAHLHPRWKVQVMSGLRKALPGMTFIVTTHDPLCLRGMQDEEIVVLQRVASADAGVESDVPVVVERMTNLPAASGLRLEQLLTSDFFQLFSTSDPAADVRMAKVADLLDKEARRETLTPEESRTLRRFQADIAGALPVGTTIVHQMVQTAVAKYLKRRREASSKTLAGLSKTAKSEILEALGHI